MSEESYQGLNVGNIENLLNKKDELLSALGLIDNRGQLAKRRFGVYSGLQESEVDVLIDSGLLKEFRPPYPVVIRRKMDRIIDSEKVSVQLEVGDEVDEAEANENIEKLLFEWCSEAEKAGYEIPFDYQQGIIFRRFERFQDEINDIVSDIYFENSEKSQNFDSEKYGFPLVTHLPYQVSLTDEGSKFLSNEHDLDDVDPGFPEKFERVHKDIGVFTAITKQNVQSFRTIYPVVRDEKLDENNLGETLLQIEEKIGGGVTTEELRNVISKVKDDFEGGVAA